MLSLAKLYECLLSALNFGYLKSAWPRATMAYPPNPHQAGGQIFLITSFPQMPSPLAPGFLSTDKNCRRPNNVITRYYPSNPGSRLACYRDGTDPVIRARQIAGSRFLQYPMMPMMSDALQTRCGHGLGRISSRGDALTGGKSQYVQGMDHQIGRTVLDWGSNPENTRQYAPWCSDSSGTTPLMRLAAAFDQHAMVNAHCIMLGLPRQSGLRHLYDTVA
jgi:hypothetical protein